MHLRQVLFQNKSWLILQVIEYSTYTEMLLLLKQFIQTKIHLRYILKNTGKRLLLVETVLLENTPYFSDRYYFI